MRRIVDYILGIIILVLFTCCIFFYYNYSELKQDMILMQQQETYLVDSLKFTNEFLSKEIDNLQLQIKDCEYQIDSLKKVKKAIIIKYSFKESNSITEGVSQLKDNLKWNEK